ARTRAGLRRGALRSQCLAEGCGTAPGGNVLLDRGPRLDERDGSERTKAAAGQARRRGPDYAGVDRRSLRARASMTLPASIAVGEVLLLLKIGFLVLLYLFIWRVVRTASKDMRSAPQESMILAPQTAAEQKRRQRDRERGKVKPAGKLVVVSSPALRTGEEHAI